MTMFISTLDTEGSVKSELFDATERGFRDSQDASFKQLDQKTSLASAGTKKANEEILPKIVDDTLGASLWALTRCSYGNYTEIS